MEHAPRIVGQGKVCIDISGDFRFADPCVYEQWYGRKHTAREFCTQAAYGLTELFRDRVSQAALIANPGCYPTGALLALAPLLEKGLVSHEGIIVDSKSGVSGAGRRTPGGGADDGYGFAELDENFTAYRLTRHQHTPEIETYLEEVCGHPVVVSFTPHLVPMTRGILTTGYANLTRPNSAEKLHRALMRRYRREPFIRVLPLGQVPATKRVLGTNLCDIGVFADDRTNRAIVVTAIDNLGKGAAGQAIQNLNVRLGLEETTGLLAAPVYP